MKRWMLLVLFLAVACYGRVSAEEAQEAMPQDITQEVIIADFEGWPNNLGGEVGVYGALEPNWDDITSVPYSWVYEAITPGYNPKNVYSGKQAFRLVNGLGSNPEVAWGSFAMDLGPTTDLTVIPKKVESFDASGFKCITFWVKGDKGGEKMEFLVRDAHALNYMPQVKLKLSDVTTEWQKVVIPLSDISGKIDLTALDNIGLAFGRDVGNLKGEVIYIDDFMFTNTQ
ncbi:MAG: carbohydrate binding domain-containing protein [Candidatus Omnitrophota bacterium]